MNTRLSSIFSIALFAVIFALCVRRADEVHAIQAANQSAVLVMPGQRPIPETASRYSVLVFGNLGGILQSWKSDDNAVHFHLEYKIKDKGPKVDEAITLNNHGIPTSLDLNGNGYIQEMEVPVEDHFSLQGGKASWKNFAERGERTLNGDAFYFGMPISEGMLSAVPGEIALLAKALLSAPNQKLSLIPSGEAAISRVGELKVETGGKSKTVIRYEINGIDFAPIPIWFEEDGTFFSLTPGLNLIREGWESVMPALKTAQAAAAKARIGKLASQLAHKSDHPVAFRHANLFDSESAEMRPNMTVVVSGNHIQAVGSDSQVKIPGTAEIIDASGKSLLPGFWDMHTHLTEYSGLRHIASGVTTVRDLGNSVDLVQEIRRNFDSGTSIGPRVILSGLIDGRGPLQAPTELLVDTDEEARAAVDRLVQLGYDQVKLYGSIKHELVPKIAKMAHDHDLRIGGHVPAFMTTADAVRNGYDEINHINYLFLNFMEDVGETRTSLRYIAVAERAPDIDLGSEKVLSFIRFLKERGTLVDPTLSLYESRFTARPGIMDPVFAPVGDRLPPRVRRNALLGGVPVPPGKDQRYLDSYEALLRMDLLLYKSGIPILTGSDAAGDSLPGLEYQRELELQVRAGIPAPEVLRMATLRAAKTMKRDTELGSITVGKLADMVLIDGNPAARIQDIRRVDVVMKNGAIYSAKDLNAAVNILP